MILDTPDVLLPSPISTVLFCPAVYRDTGFFVIVFRWIVLVF